MIVTRVVASGYNASWLAHSLQGKNDLSAGQVLTCSNTINAAKQLEAPGHSAPPGLALSSTVGSPGRK